MVNPPGRVVLAEMIGADVFGPDTQFSFVAEDVRGLVIDRRAFDRHIGERALKAGAELELHTAVKSIRKGTVTAGGREISASVIVGADGASSMVRRSMDVPGPKYLFPSVQYDMPDWKGPENRISIIVDHDIAPGFFGWAVPHGEGARIGTAVVPGSMPAGDSIKLTVARFREAGYLGSGAMTSIVSGTIPIGPLGKISTGNTLIIGDAAAQVKPISGGGLYPALTAADIAVTAIEGFLSGDSVLREYDRAWKKRFHEELSFGMKAREAFISMDNANIDRLFRILAREEVSRTISKHGDIDHPSRLSGPLIKTAPDIVGEIAKTYLGDALKTLKRRFGLGNRED
jgi:flavin-dependent dehydrogenase